MYNIAIDLGGTVVKVGLLLHGNRVDCARMDSQMSLGLAPNLPRIKETINNLLSRNHVTAGTLTGIGLAFPGLVNPRTCRVISRPFLFGARHCLFHCYGCR